MDIGIVGCAVAGAYAASMLARQGHRIVAFERLPDREKPCGGGVTEKAISAFDEIRDLSAPFRAVKKLTVVSAGGTIAHTPVDRPFRIYSRSALDSALRDMAQNAGAIILKENVRSIEKNSGRWTINGSRQFDFLVGAGGYADPVARYFGRSFRPADTAPMVGYFAPGDFGDHVVIRLLKHFPGYIWIFPRTDHASIGLMAPGDKMHAPSAYRVLDAFVARYFPDVDIKGATRFGAPAPMIMHNHRLDPPICGADWALIGDAAGLCDPMTGEGIYHALTSARLLARSLAEGDPLSYASKIDETVRSELYKATRLKRKFFRGWLSEASIYLMKRSAACGGVARDFIAGSQDYRTLRPVTIRVLPSIFFEALSPFR